MTTPRTVAVVTGSRADYGLLRPVKRAIRDRPDLDLLVLATGTHLLPAAGTHQEVAPEFEVAAMIPMQETGRGLRADEAIALGRGICGLGAFFAHTPVDIVLLLGDRIEAFAAAAAAAVAGVRVAHMHGGDRAEGIADESLRHAITKLAHVHLPATEQSARRIAALGEEPRRIHLVGSPAVDGLSEVPPLDDDAFGALGRPEILFMLHPAGDSAAKEQRRAEGLLAACGRSGRVLAMDPNYDAGRDGIMAAIGESGCPRESHLPRGDFISLLKRAKLLVGNSSAGLIECAALGVRCVNVGTRQAGRELPDNVIDVPEWEMGRIEAAISRGLAEPSNGISHPFGGGRAGPRTAKLLATLDFSKHPLTKLNAY